ncbi:hypothetical protein D0B32_05385 [Paraburkholderia sp. DHOC27]|nr:hypothetical protein D0B32_05385 [Paraburkholderia sp. DHOC27]
MTAGVCAEPTCPGFVETHSGSTFNLAALIHDKGSPAAALDDARRAVSRVNAGGGCGIFKDPAACEETLAVAKLAIDALEACTGTRSLSGSARKDPF